MKVLIDNGHGEETPGKRSPDGMFREYAYNRLIARRLVTDLKDRGVDAELLVPEENDISLKERVQRVNDCCREHGKSNVILVSIHVNAAGGDNRWHNARGWSAYTSKGITRSDMLAYCLYEAAEKNLAGQQIRLFNGKKEPDFEEDFYILRNTLCPAVLTENFFQDNKADIAFLQSEIGKQKIVDTHVEGILEYLEYL